MDFASFDDYWTPFLGGATPTSSYAATLSDELRQTLIARLRQKVLGDGPDRPLTLPARAWVVRGIVPEHKPATAGPCADAAASWTELHFGNARQRSRCFQIAYESGLAHNEDWLKLGMK